jgi:hypothetical protein
MLPAKGKRGGASSRDFTPLARIDMSFAVMTAKSPKRLCKTDKAPPMPLSDSRRPVKTKLPRLGWRASAKGVGVECVPPPLRLGQGRRQRRAE